MNRILLTAAAAIAAAVIVPSVAQAATLHQDGRTPHRILLQDTAGETNLISVEGKSSVVIQDLNVPIEIAGVPTCMPLDAYTVSCSAVRRVELDLGVGPDVARIDTPHAVEIEGGPGSDRYVATASDAPSRVTFSGGIGLDTANYFFATAGVDVSVDREASDGRPGDEDRILRDVESVIGSNFADSPHRQRSHAAALGPGRRRRDHGRRRRGDPLRRARATTASTPATARRTPSTAVASSSTRPWSISGPRPRSRAAPTSPDRDATGGRRAAGLPGRGPESGLWLASPPGFCPPHCHAAAARLRSARAALDPRPGPGGRARAARREGARAARRGCSSHPGRPFRPRR